LLFFSTEKLCFGTTAVAMLAKYRKRSVFCMDQLFQTTVYGKVAATFPYPRGVFRADADLWRIIEKIYMKMISDPVLKSQKSHEWIKQNP
jgi:hypothetical protein